MRKYLLHVLIISIFSLVLFACPFVSAQSHKLADEYWSKAHELQKQGKYLDAAEMFEKSAQAERARPSPRMQALTAQLNAAGYFYKLVGQYDKAFKYYKEALAIDRKLGKEGSVAIRLNNIGTVYHSWGKYDKAIEYYEEALAIARKLGKEGNIGMYLGNIGWIYGSQGKYKTSIKYYTESVKIKEKLRKTATGNIRRDYLASQLGTYQWLTSAYIMDSDI